MRILGRPSQPALPQSPVTWKANRTPQRPSRSDIARVARRLSGPPLPRKPHSPPPRPAAQHTRPHPPPHPNPPPKPPTPPPRPAARHTSSPPHPYPNPTPRGARIMTRRIRSIGLTTMMTAALVTVLTGCSSPTAASSSNAPASQLRLGYFANVTHAPAIAGLQKGFLQDALGTTKLSTQVF